MVALVTLDYGNCCQTGFKGWAWTPNSLACIVSVCERVEQQPQLMQVCRIDYLKDMVPEDQSQPKMAMLRTPLRGGYLFPRVLVFDVAN